MYKVTTTEDARFVPPTMIHCPSCAKRKASYEFYVNRARPNGRTINCKRCIKAKNELRKYEKADLKRQAKAPLRANKAEKEPVEMMVLCPSCNTAKPLSGFAKCSTRKNGVQSHCKVCRNKYNRTRRVSIKHKPAAPKLKRAAKPGLFARIKKALLNLFA